MLSPDFKKNIVLDWQGYSLYDQSGIQTVPFTNNNSMQLGVKNGILRGAGRVDRSTTPYLSLLDANQNRLNFGLEDFAIELWVNLINVDSGRNSLIGKIEDYLATKPGWMFIYRGSNDTVRFEICDGTTGGELSIAPELSKNVSKLVHLLIFVDKDDGSSVTKVTLYKDGVSPSPLYSAAYGSVIGSVDNAFPLKIGSYTAGGGVGGIGGLFSRVRLYRFGVNGLTDGKMTDLVSQTYSEYSKAKTIGNIVIPVTGFGRGLVLFDMKDHLDVSEWSTDGDPDVFEFQNGQLRLEDDEDVNAPVWFTNGVNVKAGKPYLIELAAFNGDSENKDGLGFFDVIQSNMSSNVFGINYIFRNTDFSSPQSLSKVAIAKSTQTVYPKCILEDDPSSRFMTVTKMKLTELHSDSVVIRETFDYGADGVTKQIPNWISDGAASVKIVETEINGVRKNAMKFSSDGNMSIPCDVAYGEWEFSVNCSNENIAHECYILSDKTDIENQNYGTGYYLVLYLSAAPETFSFRKTVAGTRTVLSSGDDLLASDGIWYRFKFIRDLSNDIYVYVKGGEYGWNGWVLFGLATNPITDADITASSYFTLNFRENSMVSDIVIRRY